MPIDLACAPVDGGGVAVGPAGRAGLGFLDGRARLGGHDGRPVPVEA